MPRRMPWPRICLLLAALLVAGCLAPASAPAPEGGEAAPFAARVHVLEGVRAPTSLEAPTFAAPILLSANGFKNGGEPSIRAHLDGTLYVTHPGCDNKAPFAQEPDFAYRQCWNGPIHRSADGGVTWTRLNPAENGTLTEDAPRANGDADVVTDAAGTVYVTHLGGGVQLFRSDAGGDSFRFMGNVTPPGHWADRQWMAATKPGHLVVAWMGGETREQRAVAFRTTTDGGESWGNVQYVGDAIGWLGPVQFSPDAERAYLPYTVPLNDFVRKPYGQVDFAVHVAVSEDAGFTWKEVDTGARIRTTFTGGHWSGVLMLPVLDVTADGTVVAAWSEDVPDPLGLTSVGARIRYVASGDGGESWTTPRTVPTGRTTAIMPWVVGGGGDRFAVTYYATDSVMDSDLSGVWDVSATVVESARADAPRGVGSIVEPAIHVGGICGLGDCDTPYDRSLLDFFESAITPDGRLIVSYTATRSENGRFTEVRFAIQDGGTLLFDR